MRSPVVTITTGQLQGEIRVNFDGDKFFSFLGIPYGKTPTGNLRFKAPLPAESWSGVRDVTKDGDICYSKDDITGVIHGSEDCLHLNVFTKELPHKDSKLKPVMVWIHGGGFIIGSNQISIYGPEFLMIEDIVLVSISYRLGLLGFLSLGPTLEVPGNAGLKDQVLALKWVQENIKYFNGDPNNVTIFGESAGAASVHFLLLSTTTKGLFHRAILQSGCALNHWSFGNCNAIRVVKQLGYEVKTEKEALEILNNTPFEKLYEVQCLLDGNLTPAHKRLIGAAIEYPNNTAFLTRKVIDIIKSGEYNKVPLIFGYTTREGVIADLTETFLNNLSSDGLSKFENNISWQLNLERDSENYSLICKKFKDFYFIGGDEQDNQYVLQTDSWFLAGIMASLKNHFVTNQKPIYLYRMSVDTSLNYMKNQGNLLHVRGTCHGDDLGYLFKSFLTPLIKPGSLEDISVRRFVKLWTNFAKYGNPTPDGELSVTWQQITDGKINFIDIGEDITLGVNPETERIALWKDIFQLSPETANFL